ARPKALVSDGKTRWIAKFGNEGRDDHLDVPGLEHVCMSLAGSAGLRVANTRIERFATGNVLLVERFDLSGQGGRIHAISLHTLCKESPGLFVLSYKEVAERVRKHSSRPSDDLSMFFRQMTFNALVGNVDDHLKNFIMIRDEGGYRLSPAFDITPDITGKTDHSLSFLYANTTSGRELVEIGKHWGIDEPGDIVTEV
ncbi:HipA domain-containing protein, partial [mine drainage metagenome]